MLQLRAVLDLRPEDVHQRNRPDHRAQAPVQGGTPKCTAFRHWSPAARAPRRRRRPTPVTSGYTARGGRLPTYPVLFGFRVGAWMDFTVFPSAEFHFMLPRRRRPNRSHRSCNTFCWRPPRLHRFLKSTVVSRRQACRQQGLSRFQSVGACVHLSPTRT